MSLKYLFWPQPLTTCQWSIYFDHSHWPHVTEVFILTTATDCMSLKYLFWPQPLTTCHWSIYFDHSHWPHVTEVFILTTATDHMSLKYLFWLQPLTTCHWSILAWGPAAPQSLALNISPPLAIVGGRTLSLGWYLPFVSAHTPESVQSVKWLLVVTKSYWLELFSCYLTPQNWETKSRNYRNFYFPFGKKLYL